jgi:transcriptional regulator with XRE-family HTH domain
MNPQTQSTYSLIRETQDAAAVEFGRMLRRWRSVNGWTQYTAKRWATEAGLEETIRHSGLSELERGITRSPRNVVFLSLANLNRLVHEQQFKGVRSRDLLDQLKGSRAICGESTGEPWGPAEFWSCHAGLLPAVSWLAPLPAHPMPELDDEQAAELCAGWGDQAREAARAAGAGGAQLMAIGGFAPPKLRQQWQGVALGIDAFSAQELAGLWNPDGGGWLPEQWLAAWRESLSGGGGVSPEPCHADSLPLSLPMA